MPRGQYARTPKGSTSIEVATIKPEIFSALSWWKKLSAQEQTAVIGESQQLGSSLLQFGQARLAVGQHLEKIQAILEPHNVFQKFLKTFRFSPRTAYRYISGFKNASSMLPAPIVKAAMARGVPIVGDTDAKPLGVYTEVVKTLPPPQAPTEQQANQYLDALEKMRRETRTTNVLELPVGDPNTLLKETLRFAALRYKRLPHNKRTREAWASRLVGMLLAEFGLVGQHTFSSIPVPVEFQVQRGRPKQIAASA